MAKKKDIQKLGDEELAIEIRDARRKLYDLRSQQVTEKIEDTSQYAKLRRNVARLLSEQSMRRNQKVEVSS